MKRLIILVLLAFGVAACGGDSGASATDAADSTPEATEEATATAEPTEEASPSADAGNETALSQLIPDELNGVPGTPIPGMDQFMAGILSQQGIEAENIEFEFVTYGETEDAVVLTAFRIPGISEPQMELLAQMLSGAGDNQGVETETVTIDGKSVLRMSVAQAGEEGTVYMYFTQGAAFTIVSQDPAAAEALVGELP